MSDHSRGEHLTILEQADSSRIQILEFESKIECHGWKSLKLFHWGDSWLVPVAELHGVAPFSRLFGWWRRLIRNNIEKVGGVHLWWAFKTRGRSLNYTLEIKTILRYHDWFEWVSNQPGKHNFHIVKCQLSAWLMLDGRKIEDQKHLAFHAQLPVLVP